MSELLDRLSPSTSLAPGASCGVTVTFKPTTEGFRSASLVVGSNGGQANTLLSGEGLVDEGPPPPPDAQSAIPIGQLTPLSNI